MREKEMIWMDEFVVLIVGVHSLPGCIESLMEWCVEW